MASPNRCRSITADRSAAILELVECAVARAGKIGFDDRFDVVPDRGVRQPEPGRRPFAKQLVAARLSLELELLITV